MTRAEIRALPIVPRSEGDACRAFDLVARPRRQYDSYADALVEFDAADRCVRVSVMVDGDCKLYLGEEHLRGHPGSELEDILARLGAFEYSYASTQVPTRGIEATKWEHSDSFYCMVGVFPPRPGRRDGTSAE